MILAKSLRKRTPKPIIRTFIFDSGNQANSRLEVKLEYAAPSVVTEGVEREKKRVLGASRYNRLEDQDATARDIEEIMAVVLADRVISIKAVGGGDVTVRQVAQLVAMNPDDIRDFGGLDAKIIFDTEDKSVLTDEQKSGLGKDALEIENAGDIAKANTKWLLSECRRFYDWVGQVASDVSYFQDSDWEKSVGNSLAA